MKQDLHSRERKTLLNRIFLEDGALITNLGLTYRPIADRFSFLILLAVVSLPAPRRWSKRSLALIVGLGTRLC